MTHANKKIGIYQIKNLITGLIYIGSSINIHARWKKHKYELKKRIHPNKKLLNSYIKNGEENFEFLILEEVNDSKNLLEREQYYINLHKNNLYNIREKAESNIGFKHSEDTKTLLKKHNTGRTHTDEARAKISLANKGRKFSEETIKKMSVAKKGKSNHWKGKKRSEEQKQKISEMAKKRTGILNANSKLKQEDIQKIKDLFYIEKKFINDIAKLYNVSRSTIKRVIHCKTYISTSAI